MFQFLRRSTVGLLAFFLPSLAFCQEVVNVAFQSMPITVGELFVPYPINSSYQNCTSPLQAVWAAKGFNMGSSGQFYVPLRSNPPFSCGPLTFTISPFQTCMNLPLSAQRNASASNSGGAVQFIFSGTGGSGTGPLSIQAPDPCTNPVAEDGTPLYFVGCGNGVSEQGYTICCYTSDHSTTGCGFNPSSAK